MAFILQHRIWRGCKLRVHTVAEQLDNSVAVKANLQALLHQVRPFCTSQDANLPPRRVSFWTKGCFYRLAGYGAQTRTQVFLLARTRTPHPFSKTKTRILISLSYRSLLHYVSFSAAPSIFFLRFLRFSESSTPILSPSPSESEPPHPRCNIPTLPTLLPSLKTNLHLFPLLKGTH